MKLRFRYLKSTATCHRFEAGSKEAGTLVTLYLKKADLAAAGIDHTKGITITIEEAKDE
ncbi:MAG: hypothetical protein ACOYIR_07540 [Christensenellales bacterium]|jgi:hypothetical protein